MGATYKNLITMTKTQLYASLMEKAEQCLSRRDAIHLINTATDLVGEIKAEQQTYNQLTYANHH
jgi:nucleoid DNA-binding protein